MKSGQGLRANEVLRATTVEQLQKSRGHKIWKETVKARRIDDWTRKPRGKKTWHGINAYLSLVDWFSGCMEVKAWSLSRRHAQSWRRQLNRRRGDWCCSEPQTRSSNFLARVCFEILAQCSVCMHASLTFLRIRFEQRTSDGGPVYKLKSTVNRQVFGLFRQCLFS